jgi:hypothetical protein
MTYSATISEHHADEPLVTRADKERFRLSDRGRWVLGALTLLSPLSLIGVGVLALMGAGRADPAALDGWSLAFLAYHIIGTAMLLLFYLRHVLDDPRIRDLGTPTWITALVVAAPLTMPIYFSLFMARPIEMAAQSTAGSVRVRPIEA